MRIKLIATVRYGYREYLIEASKVYVNGAYLCIEPIESFEYHKVLYICCDNHEKAKQCLHHLMIEGYVDLTAYGSCKI